MIQLFQYEQLRVCILAGLHSSIVIFKGFAKMTVRFSELGTNFFKKNLPSSGHSSSLVCHNFAYFLRTPPLTASGYLNLFKLLSFSFLSRKKTWHDIPEAPFLFPDNYKLSLSSIFFDFADILILRNTEAATRGVLCKKVFLEISQNS